MSNKKNWLIIGLRFLLGIIFLLNGINMLFQLMPLPLETQPEMAKRFLNILGEAGYFFPILGIVKIATSISLFTNKYLPLMLIVMFPITLNGVLFHIVMDPEMTIMAVVVGLLQVYLIYHNRERYFSMLEPGVK